MGYNIIVQAGGKGTRLEGLTKNKPKCLVPYDNLPLIFHLFKKFPKAKFTIIADYKVEVLKNTLTFSRKIMSGGFCLQMAAGRFQA